MDFYNEKECADVLKKVIGKTFPVIFSFEYPHGRIKKEKLLSVNPAKHAGWSGNVEYEAEFSDGFKANYCSSIGGFCQEHWFFIKHYIK